MLYGLFGNVVNGGPGVYNSSLDLQAFLYWIPRNILVAIIGVVVLVTAYVGVILLNAVNTLNALVIIMIVVVTPWAVITILGMWRRRGHVFADDLHAFAIPGARGPYWYTGGINYRAVIALVAGIVVGLAFSDNSIFAGPLSQTFGGVDFSFTSAGLTGAICYLVLEALFPEKNVLQSEAAAPAPADAAKTSEPT